MYNGGGGAPKGNETQRGSLESHSEIRSTGRRRGGYGGYDGYGGLRRNGADNKLEFV